MEVVTKACQSGVGEKQVSTRSWCALRWYCPAVRPVGLLRSLRLCAEYAEFLHTYQRPLCDAGSYRDLSCLACEDGHSTFINVAFDPLMGKPTVSARGAFKMVRHYIGRLFAPKRASQFHGQASEHYPALFEGFSL